MNRLAVRQQDYSKIFTISFVYSSPSSNSTIGLYAFCLWSLDDPAYPL